MKLERPPVDVPRLALRASTLLIAAYCIAGCPDGDATKMQAATGADAGDHGDDAAAGGTNDAQAPTAHGDAGDGNGGKGAGHDPDRDAASGDLPRDASVDAGPACPEGEFLCDDECVKDFDATAMALQTRLFTQSCALSTSCHTGFTPKEGLQLTSLDDVFASAVAKPSKQDPTRKIIDPGHPERSYMIAKLRNTNIAAKSSTGKPATQMPPPPLSPLCDPKIARLEAWIKAGALRD